MKTIFIAAALFGFVSSLATPLGSLVSSEDILVGQVEATDGDSLRMGDYRIRLFGIDAVEAGQTCRIGREEWDCARESRRALERLVDGKTISCAVRDMDRGRHVAVCVADGTDIGEQMVRRGWAVAFTDFTLDYADEEAAARTEGLALWRSQFERPQDYRARLRAGQASDVAAQEAPSADCNIKGNISRDGTRIFHEPGQADYHRTRIDEAAGERWFCSPENARAEGWRRAMR